MGQAVKINTSGSVDIPLFEGENLVGLPFLGNVVVSSEVLETRDNGNLIEVPQDAVKFLDPNNLYFFEVESGDALGAVALIRQVASSQDRGVLMLSEGFSSDLKDGDRFVVRAASTIESVFGKNNLSLLASTGQFSTSDQVSIPNGEGGYDQYAYLTQSDGQGGWYSAQSGERVDAGGVVIYPQDCIKVKRVFSQPAFLAVSGVCKESPLEVRLFERVSHLSIVFSGGSTLSSLLDRSGQPGVLRADTIEAAATVGEADLIKVQKSDGNHAIYWYCSGRQRGWRLYDPDSQQSSVVNSEEVFIDHSSILTLQRRGSLPHRFNLNPVGKK